MHMGGGYGRGIGNTSRSLTVIVPQQPYSSKAPPAVYIPEDSWPANQNCKLSHTLGGKNSYTTLSQPYTPCGQPYTSCGQPYTRCCGTNRLYHSHSEV